MKLAASLVIFCVGALLTLGLVMLYSAEILPDGTRHTGSYYLMMQMTWGGAGLVLAVAMAAIDYRWLKKACWPLLGLTLVLLAGVLIYGTKTNGARRWIHLPGSFNFQPSELAKLTVITVLAFYGDRYQRYMPTFWRGLVLPGLILCAVLGLIFVEPDRGTTVLLATVGGSLLILAGSRLTFIVPPVLLGAAAFAYSVWHDPVRQRRIVSWLDPESHKRAAGFQVWQSMVCIGSGGVEGLGLGNGRQKVYVPERHTDFIFSVIGEELGLIATLATIVLFAVLMFAGTSIARRARDPFGFLLASGITLLIGLQTIINVGVVTGTFPNKGLPLPFISYGGSSLLLMLTCVGVLLGVARQGREHPSDLKHHQSVPDIAAAQLSS
jgi:cell division protein FtsW